MDTQDEILATPRLIQKQLQAIQMDVSFFKQRELRKVEAVQKMANSLPRMPKLG